jgi:hypothetical protein
MIPSGAVAATWSSPQNLSSGTNAYSWSVAAGASGTAHAIWLREGTGPTNLIVETASRTADGVWSAPVALSATGATQNARNPSIAVASDGSVHALWEAYDTGDTVWVTTYRSRAAGAAWNIGVAPDFLNWPNPNDDAGLSRLGVSADGTAFAIWAQDFGSQGSVRVWARTRPAGGAWSGRVQLSADGFNASSLRLAVPANGRAHAIWITSEGNRSVQSRTMQSNGTWGARNNLAAFGTAGSFPSVSANADGSAVVTWTVTATQAVQVVRSDTAGVWSVPETVTDTQFNSPNSASAVSPDGTGHILYTAGDGSLRSLQAGPGGAWQSSGTLTPASGLAPEDAGIRVAPSGNVHAFWRQSNGSHSIAQSAYRTPGGAWSAPAAASESGQNSDYLEGAIDAGGSLHLLWSRSNGAIRVAQSAVLAGVDAERTPLVEVPVSVAPTSAATPRIVGAARINTLLACTHGTWDGTAPIAITYSWQHFKSGAFVAIPGATGARYRAKAADRGRRIRCIVSATNAAGSAGLTSNELAMPTLARATRKPVIAGRPAAGRAATCAPGRWVGTAPRSFGYSWQRKSGKKWRTIRGSRKARFRLPSSLAGGQVRCVVTVTNAAGAAVAHSPAKRL